MNLARPASRDHVALIDLTPMIDVVFLLIVFFMTTAQFASMSKERLELPEQQGEAASAPDAGTVVNLRASGALVVSGDALTLEAFLRRVAADIARAGSPEELDLLIRADRGASAARLNDLAEGLAARGVTRWRLATERPAGGAP
jgi:biopolymer transport protein ExbD